MPRAIFGARQDIDKETKAFVMSAEVAAVAEVLVTAGYRALAKQHHPDHGGDAGTKTTYVRASIQEVAAALATLTGEPHPLM